MGNLFCRSHTLKTSYSVYVQTEGKTDTWAKTHDTYIHTHTHTQSKSYPLGSPVSSLSLKTTLSVVGSLFLRLLWACCFSCTAGRIRGPYMGKLFCWTRWYCPGVLRFLGRFLSVSVTVIGFSFTRSMTFLCSHPICDNYHDDNI